MGRWGLGAPQSWKRPQAHGHFYPYGIEASRKTLEALCRYSHDQGLASRELKISELFAEQSLEFVES